MDNIDARSPNEDKQNKTKRNTSKIKDKLYFFFWLSLLFTDFSTQYWKEVRDIYFIPNR
jgi:hypothetical protein